MALSELLDSDLDKALECSICFNDFTEPKQLKCLHNFCTQCLKQWCSDKVAGDMKPCPLCRKEFSIPPGGVDSMPNNDFLTKIIKMRRMTERGKKESKCEICSVMGQEVTADSFCMDCSQYICAKCRQSHSDVSQSSRHNVVDLEEGPREAKRSKLTTGSCSKHPSEEAKIYCCDCNDVLCYACLVLDHSRHKCDMLDELVQQKKDLLAKDEININKCLNGGLGNKFQQERDKTAQDVYTAADNIERACGEIIDMITAYKNQLLDDLAASSEVRIKEIENQAGKDEPDSTELNSLLTQGRMMLEKGTDCEIIRVADELHKRAEELIKSQDGRNKQTGQLSAHNISFLPTPMPSKEDVEKMLGRVANTAGEMRFHCWGELKTELSAEASPGLQSAITATCIQEITVLNGKIYIIRSHQAVVNVCDFQSFKTLPDIKIAYMQNPNALTSCSHHKYLYICEDRVSRIHRFCINDNKVKRWTLKHTNMSGVSMTNDHNLLLTARVIATIILEYSSEGQLIREIQLDNAVLEGWQTVQLSNDQFVICHGLTNSSLHRLCVVNALGQIVKSFGDRKGGGEGQLDVPRSVAVDNKTGRVFAADRFNGRVLMFDRDLALLGELHTPERLYPSCLCFDSASDRLVVGDGGDGNGRVVIVRVPDQ